jgi:A/G-specific adenine glycosylase
MLQQTQVARVVPRYEAWIERWPDPAALAAAPVGDVLRAWVGLGYNRRALRLHEAARAVARDGWPEDLRTLPGVGAYTAAALGAFAFGRDEVALDTNPAPGARANARARARPPAWPSGRRSTTPSMDLGATVCTASRRRCEGLSAGLRVDPAAAHVTRAPGRPGPRDAVRGHRRYVRGRVVAALAAGEALPAQVGEARLERALRRLVRDGLVVRGTAARVRLP